MRLCAFVISLFLLCHFNAYPADSAKAASLDIKVITDTKCEYCSVDKPKEMLLSSLGSVKFDNIDYRSKAGQDLIVKHKSVSLPFFVVPVEVKKNRAYDKIKDVLVENDGQFVLSSQASGVFMFLGREYRPSEIDYFFDFYDRRTAATFPVLREFCVQNKVKLNLYLIVPTIKVPGYPDQEITTALAVKEIYPDKFLDYLQERINFIETIDCTTSLSKLSMDFTRLKEWLSSPKAERALQDNAALVKELGITNGNAVLVNNQRLFMIFTASKKDLARILNKK